MSGDLQAKIATDVVAHLQGQAYDYGTIPNDRIKRLYFPLIDTAELETVFIAVACGEIDQVPQVRGTEVQYTYTIIVWIQQQFTDDPDDIDPLRRLAEQVQDYLKRTKFQGASWILNINGEPLITEEAQTSHVFRSPIRALYRIVA